MQSNNKGASCVVKHGPVCFVSSQQSRPASVMSCSVTAQDSNAAQPQNKQSSLFSFTQLPLYLLVPHLQPQQLMVLLRTNKALRDAVLASAPTVKLNIAVDKEGQCVAESSKAPALAAWAVTGPCPHLYVHIYGQHNSYLHHLQASILPETLVSLTLEGFWLDGLIPTAVATTCPKLQHLHLLQCRLDIHNGVKDGGNDDTSATAEADGGHQVTCSNLQHLTIDLNVGLMLDYLTPFYHRAVAALGDLPMLQSLHIASYYFPFGLMPDGVASQLTRLHVSIGNGCSNKVADWYSKCTGLRVLEVDAWPRLYAPNLQWGSKALQTIRLPNDCLSKQEFEALLQQQPQLTTLQVRTIQASEPIGLGVQGARLQLLQMQLVRAHELSNLPFHMIVKPVEVQRVVVDAESDLSCMDNEVVASKLQCYASMLKFTELDVNCCVSNNLQQLPRLLDAVAPLICGFKGKFMLTGFAACEYVVDLLHARGAAMEQVTELNVHIPDVGFWQCAKVRFLAVQKLVVRRHLEEVDGLVQYLLGLIRRVHVDATSAIFKQGKALQEALAAAGDRAAHVKCTVRRSPWFLL